MGLLGRGPDDLILDSLVTLSNAFSLAQVALDGDVGFTAVRDWLDPPSAEELMEGPYVIFSLDSTNPASQGNSTRALTNRAVIVADLLTANKAQAMGAIPNGDQMAMARLMYLKDQIQAVVMGLARINLGQSVGVQSIKSVSYRFFGRPGDDMAEHQVGGRLTFEIEYIWERPDLENLVNLTDVNVTVAKQNGVAGNLWTGLWTGLYSP